MNFIKTIINNVNVSPTNYLFGIVTYGNYGNLYVRLSDTQTVAQLFQRIDFIPWLDQWTNTSGGIYITRTQVFSGAEDRQNAPNIGIVITDGVSNQDTPRTIPEAELARQNGMTLLGIGVGSDVDYVELNAISTDPDYMNVFRVDSWDRIPNILNSVLDRICYYAGSHKFFSGHYIIK